MDASVHEIASTAYIAVSPPQLARRSITACPRLVCGTLVDYVSTHVTCLATPSGNLCARYHVSFRYSKTWRASRPARHARRTTLVLQTGSVGGAPAGPARMIAADKRVFMLRHKIQIHSTANFKRFESVKRNRSTVCRTQPTSAGSYAPETAWARLLVETSQSFRGGWGR